MKLGTTRSVTTLAVAAAITALSSLAWADDRGSMEDQMACTPDVYRLCSSHVPDEDAIVACLKQNIRNLSPACQKVFSRPDEPANNDNGDQ